MRTTITLDDDVYDVAQTRAKLSGLSIGKIISEMARRGMQAARVEIDEHGFPVLVSPGGTPPIDPGLVRELIADEGLDEALRLARR